MVARRGTDDMITTDRGTQAEDAGGVPPPAGLRVRLLGGLVAGAASGVAMFVVLAVVAVAQGRPVMYPAYAVQAMLSGRRVLPDHPVATLADRRASDVVLGPVLFLVPAVIVALLVMWWLGRRATGRPAAPVARQVAAPAAVLTGALFVLTVLALGFEESSPAVQRISSGYGVRQLGLTAWLVGHAVYAVLLTLLLGPAVRAVAFVRRDRTPAVALRGEGTRRDRTD